jgi:GxxExxY protein
MYQLSDEWIIVDGLVAEPEGEYLPSSSSAQPTDLTAYNPLTHRIIGCAMRVHSLLGSGFSEVIYQRALHIELEREEVSAQREIETPIYFRGQQIGTRRVDFLVDSPVAGQPVLVELKATTDLTDAHFAQIVNYLEAYRLPVGLLLNFGATSLQYRRFVKTRVTT